MASTLTAYIPNSKITVVETNAGVSFGFIDTTSYLTRIKVLADPAPLPVPPEVVLTLGSGFIIGQQKKIKLVEIPDPITITVVVTSQHFLDGLNQTIVFSVVGDTAELMWTRNGWRIISTSNILGDDSTPEISSLN